MQGVALWVAGVIFLTVTFLHIVRYIKMWTVIIADFSIPLDWSIYAAIITGTLAAWMFIAATKK